MKYVWTLIGICLILLCSATKAHADALTPGIIASPALMQLDISPTAPSVSFSTQVTNNTNSDIALEIATQDFTSLNQSGSISFLNSTNNPHGLASSLKTDVRQMKLAPKQSQTIPFTITNANALSVGGHYGAIIYKILGPDLTPYNTVTVNQAVTTLVFVTTHGRGTQALSLASQPLGRFVTSLPSSVDVVFANTGNTQTTVRGLVQILDGKSKVLSQGVINVDSGLILPGAQRLFTVAMHTLDSRYLWPSIYTVRVSYRYEGQTNFTIQDEAFIYIAWQQLVVIITAVIALALILLALFRDKIAKSGLHFRRSH